MPKPPDLGATRENRKFGAKATSARPTKGAQRAMNRLQDLLRTSPTRIAGVSAAGVTTIFDALCLGDLGFEFDIYASGEYSRMLEQEWSASESALEG